MSECVLEWGCYGPPWWANHFCKVTRDVFQGHCPFGLRLAPGGVVPVLVWS